MNQQETKELMNRQKQKIQEEIDNLEEAVEETISNDTELSDGEMLDVEVDEDTDNLYHDLLQDNAVDDTADDAIKRPMIFDPAWHDYVMSHFTEDEKQFGSPTVDGLRRVTELLLAPIANCHVQLVQESNQANNYHVVASCQLDIDGKVYSDLGDATRDELASNNLHHVAAAVAATRAEARCLRKALRLKRTVLAAEERKTDESNSGVWNGNQPIHSSQMACIDQLLRRHDVDGEKFLMNAGSKRFDSLKSVSFSDAQGMIEFLNKFGDEKNEVPQSLKGYKANWLV